MEALLAIASKRDVREYAETPVARETQDRILDAGRLSGSARNRQPWRFVVAEGEAARLTLARAVYRPEVVVAAPFSLLVAGLPGSALTLMDIGRAAQNMMLCAWDLGVVSYMVKPVGLPELQEAMEHLTSLFLRIVVRPAGPGNTGASEKPEVNEMGGWL